jgi:hypothetical protein
MKRLFLLFLLSISIFSCSQDKSENSTIKTDFEKYFRSIQNKNIGEAINCIYPKFFEIVPKEQMKQMLELTYNNPQLGLSINKFNIDNISKVEKIKNEYFTTINYSFDVDLKLNSDELKSKKDLLQEGLERKFGSANVKFESEKQIFSFNSSKKAIGISENGKSDWKFVVIENEYKPYLLKILPEKIINEN